MKVACVPSVAPPGTSVRCAANVENPDDLKKLSELVSAGGRWGYYWYVNKSAQNSTGASIPVTIPKTGGAEVVARLMVTDPTATATPGYDADYGGAGPIGPQLQEAGRAGATLQAQSTGPRTGGSDHKEIRPFCRALGFLVLNGGTDKERGEFLRQGNRSVQVGQPEHGCEDVRPWWLWPLGVVCPESKNWEPDDGCEIVRGRDGKSGWRNRAGYHHGAEHSRRKMRGTVLVRCRLRYGSNRSDNSVRRSEG